MSIGPDCERAVMVREKSWPGSWISPDEIDRFFELRPIALWVEDNESLVMSLRLSLEAAGFDATDARWGGEALRVLDRSPTDVVILDLGLPDELGGAVLDRLRQGTGENRPAYVLASALDRGLVDRLKELVKR